MKWIAYYFLIKPFSMLPMRVLYIITWPFYFLLVHVVRYRRKVVDRNIRMSFPEKSEKEHKKIRRKFYRHLGDLMVESLRMFSIPLDEYQRRFKVLNPEILEPLKDAGKNVILVTGHYGNWEYSCSLDPQIPHKAAGIYKPIKNQFFEKVVLHSRTRHGILAIPVTGVSEFFRAKHEDPFLMIFISDQSPKPGSKHYWVNFLNQDTAVAVGTERYAKMLDMPVVFGYIRKVKRGHYTMEMEILDDNPKASQEGEITEKHVRALEKNILEAPEYWLWSHKRWKKSRAESETKPREKKAQKT